jgi:hypothetical protein
MRFIHCMYLYVVILRRLSDSYNIYYGYKSCVRVTFNKEINNGWNPSAMNFPTNHPPHKNYRTKSPPSIFAVHPVQYICAGLYTTVASCNVFFFQGTCTMLSVLSPICMVKHRLLFPS